MVDNGFDTLDSGSHRMDDSDFMAGGRKNGHQLEKRVSFSDQADQLASRPGPSESQQFMRQSYTDSLFTENVSRQMRVREKEMSWRYSFSMQECSLFWIFPWRFPIRSVPMTIIERKASMVMGKVCPEGQRSSGWTFLIGFLWLVRILHYCTVTAYGWLIDWLSDLVVLSPHVICQKLFLLSRILHFKVISILLSNIFKFWKKIGEVELMECFGEYFGESLCCRWMIDRLIDWLIDWWIDYFELFYRWIFSVLLVFWKKIGVITSGNDQHVAMRENRPRELELDDKLYGFRGDQQASVLVQTPPRTLTVNQHAFPAANGLDRDDFDNEDFSGSPMIAPYSASGLLAGDDANNMERALSLQADRNMTSSSLRNQKRYADPKGCS